MQHSDAFKLNFLGLYRIVIGKLGVVTAAQYFTLLFHGLHASSRHDTQNVVYATSSLRLPVMSISTGQMVFSWRHHCCFSDETLPTVPHEA
jgi:hypothetical protein